LEGGKTVCAELAFADHVCILDAGDGCGSGMEGLEAQHRSGDALDEAMVLFKNVIQVFDLQDFDDGPCSCELQDHVRGMQASQIGSTLIDDHPVRHAICRDCAFEKRRAAAVSRRSDNMKSRV
jgi:hypothetical protein